MACVVLFVVVNFGKSAQETMHLHERTPADSILDKRDIMVRTREPAKSISVKEQAVKSDTTRRRRETTSAQTPGWQRTRRTHGTPSRIRKVKKPKIQKVDAHEDLSAVRTARSNARDGTETRRNMCVYRV